MISRLGAMQWCSVLILCLSPALGPAAAAAPASTPEQRQRVEQAVAKVLDSREFAQLSDTKGNWLHNWLMKASQAVGDFFAGLPRWVAWVIVIWMVLTLVAIMIHLVWTLWITLGGRALKTGSGHGAEGGPLEWLGVRDLQFDSVLARAKALREEGRWAEAVRFGYVAALLWLQDRQAIAYHASKTNRDFVREVANRPPVAKLLAAMTTSFETIVYRGRDATAHDATAIEQSIQRLQHEIPSA